MDGTMLIALAIVGFIALIVVIVMIKSKKQAVKRRSGMLDLFDRIVADEGLEISKKEILRNKIFAIDELKMMMVVILNHGEVHYDIIQLTMINDCKVKRSGTRTTEKQNSRIVSEEHVNEIALSLILENKSVIEIPVYSELHDGILEKMPLTAVAEKWQNIIRKALIKG